MEYWRPFGLVSPLPLPERCGVDEVIAVWMPVEQPRPEDPLPVLTNVPLVDALEASTFATAKSI